MPREPLLTRPFLIGFAACFVQAMAFHMYLHLPGFLSQIGADEVTIGWIAAVASLAAILVRPPVGRLMDLRGRRLVILCGGLLNTVSLALYLTVHEIGAWVYVVRTLQGISQAMLFSAFFTHAADTIPESRRTEGIGLFGISGMLPIGLGPTLGDWILSRGDYGDLFAVSVGLGAISLLLSTAVRDHPLGISDGAPSRGFASTLAQPDLLPLWFIGAVFSTASASVFIFLKTYVLDTGIGELGSFFRAYSLAAVLIRLFLGWLPDAVGPKRVFVPALLLLGAGLLQVPLLGASIGFTPAGLVCGVAHGYAVPILNGLIVSRARDSERGAAMSISTALFDVGFLVGGPLLGWLIDRQGYAAMYFTAAGIVFAGTTTFVLWDRRAPQRSTPRPA